MSQLEKADSVSDNSYNNFFTKKRVIILFIATIFVITFSTIISIFLLKIDPNSINNFFSEGFKQANNMFFIWLFLMFLFPLFASFWRYIVLYIRLRRENCKAKWYDWIFLIFIGSFLNAVTPFSIGNEPYTLFWLKTNGLETRKALLILASTGITSSLSQIVITWPSFFVVSASYGMFGQTPAWSLGYWLAFAGLTFDLIAFFSFFALTYSRRIHFVLNRVYYWLRKKLKMSYKTKEDIRIKYIQKAVFKEEFIEEMKNYKFYIFVLSGNVLWNVILYSSMYFSFRLSGSNYDISFSDWYNYTNIAFTANNWVPIPGGEGTLQILIISFINGMNTNLDDVFKESVNNIIFIWRIFTFYLSAIIGMICLPISAGLFYKGIKNNLK
ncbi:MAG: lysylphosphatidylglycerol synthase transmembrane domain-containing protein [Mycoplasmoidaceae bacterium]